MITMWSLTSCDCYRLCITVLRFSGFVCLFVFDRGAREAIRDVSGLGQHQPSAERVDSQLFS